MSLPKKKKPKKLKESRSKGKRKKKEVREVALRGSWLLRLGLGRKTGAHGTFGGRGRGRPESRA